MLEFKFEGLLSAGKYKIYSWISYKGYFPDQVYWIKAWNKQSVMSFNEK